VSAVLGEVQAEVVALHDFFTCWFTGALPRTDSDFAKGLGDHLHPAFEMVQPSGEIFDHDGTLSGLRQAWGVNPDFRIEIRDVRILGVWPGLVMAEYVEAQFGARNSVPSDNLRRSTALFERQGDRLLWRHLHETALAG
jgi:hypothetical protein